MSKVKKCAGKECFQRLNYLYQASNLLATKSENCNKASIMYSNLAIGVAKKSVQRLDVDLKRTICKGCRSILLAGINCRVRIKKKKAIWTCLKCMTYKTFVLPKNDYKTWSQKEESVVETLDYNTEVTEEKETKT